VSYLLKIFTSNATSLIPNSKSFAKTSILLSFIIIVDIVQKKKKKLIMMNLAINKYNVIKQMHLKTHTFTKAHIHKNNPKKIQNKILKQPLFALY